MALAIWQKSAATPQLAETPPSHPSPLPYQEAKGAAAGREAWRTTIALLVLLPIAVFIAFYNLESPSISWGDESTHIQATQSMLRTGRWWLPQVQNARYFSKPPFKMWLSLIPAHFLGQSAFSFRLIDALCGLGTLLLVFFFARRQFGSNFAALTAGCALFGCKGYIFGHGIRSAVQDSMLVFLSTTALLLLWHLIERLSAENLPPIRQRFSFIAPPGPWRQTTPSLKCALLAGVVLGLAGLTKSVAALLPLLIFGGYLLLSGVIFRNRRIWVVLLAIAVPTLLIPAFYFVPHCLFTPGACRVMFGSEVIERVSSGFNNRGMPLFYLVRLFPDRFAVPPELLIVALAYAAYKLQQTRHGLSLFLLIWACLPVIFFSFVPSRLSWYISPSFPAMSLLIGALLGSLGAYVAQEFSRWWEHKRALGLMLPLAAILLVTACADLANNLRLVSAQVLSKAQRTDFDLLVSSILQNSPNTTSPGVLVYDAPNLSRQEDTYLDMLQSRVHRLKALDDGASSSMLRNSESFPLMLTNYHQLATIAAQRKVEAFALFPPTNDRRRWLMALCSASCERYSSLTPVSRLYDFGKDALEILEGFGHNTTFHALSVRYLKSQPHRARTRGAFVLPGNALLADYGSTIALNLGAVQGEIGPLEISLNERRVGTLTLSSSGINTYSLDIPANVWRRGKNTMTFAFAGAEKSALLVNWMRVTAVLPATNN